MDRISRKDFLKLAGFTVLGLAGCKFGDAATQTAATAGQPVNAAAGSLKHRLRPAAAPRCTLPGTLMPNIL